MASMTRLGMDVDVVDAVARELTSAAQSLRSITSALDRSLSRVQGVWIGRDSAALADDWRRQHTQLDRLAQALDDYARQAQRQAAEQRRASESTGSGGVGDAPTPRPRGPWRRDEPATEQQVRDIATRLKVIGQPSIRDHYPQAYAKAEAWGEELQNDPKPSAAEVAAFQKYCYLLSLANVNRADVHDFATIAAENFDDGSKAAVEAVYGTIKAGIPGGSTTDLATLSAGHAAGLVAEGAVKGGVGWAGAEIRGAVVEKLTPEMVPGVVAAYDREADAFLADAYTRAHAVSTSSVSTGSSIMSMFTDEYDGHLATMRIEADETGAFDYVTGTGTLGDSALRGTLDFVPGVGIGMKVSDILGNSVKSGVAADIGSAAFLQARLGGMDSLRRAAAASGFE